MSKHFHEQSRTHDQAVERAAQSYEFAPFCLDVARRLLFRNGLVVPLRPKAIETLLALVERRGRLVETEELMALLWPEAVAVEPNNLTFHICQIRHALGEKPREHRYIITHPRRGYEFVSDAEEPVVSPRRKF